MSWSRCQVCKQEGNGQVQRPKQLSPVCLVKVGSWDSCDSRGHWASLGLGGSGHSGNGRKFGPLAPPCLLGGRWCRTEVAGRARGCSIPPATSGHCRRRWSHGPEGVDLPFEQVPRAHALGTVQSRGRHLWLINVFTCWQLLSGVTLFFLFLFLFRSGGGVGLGGDQRWRCTVLRNQLAYASSKYQVPFAEEVRGVQCGHAEHSWAA